MSALIIPAILAGQEPEDDSEIKELNPFIVNDANDAGYQSLTTLSVTRTNLDLKDIPQSITVLNRDLIDDLGVSDYQEILEYSAAGRSQSGEDGLRREFNVRGLTSRFSKRNSFIWYNPIDQYVIDRVEVVRGPAGLLYGEGEPSGVVNTQTKQARFTSNFGEVTHRIGSYDEQRFTFDVNRILWDDRVAIRLAGLNSSRDTFRDQEHHEHDGIFVNLNIQPVSWASVRFEYQKDEKSSINPSPIMRLNGVALDEAGLAQFRDLDIDNSQSFGGSDQTRVNDFSNYTFFVDLNPVEWFALSLGYNEQDQNLSERRFNGNADLILPGETGFNQLNPFTVPAVALRPDGGDSNNLVETFIATASIDWNLDLIQNKFVLGYQDEKDNFQLEVVQQRDENNNRPITFFPLSGGSDFDATPDLPGYRFARGFSIDQAGDNGGRETESYFIAYQGKVWDERIRIFAGFRNDDFFKTGKVGFSGLESVFRDQGEDVFNVDSINYGVVVALDPEQNFNLYYNHAESFRPAGSFRTDPLGNGLDPSIGSGDEIGLKFSLLDNKISGIATYFDIEFGGSDFRVTTDDDIWDPDDVAVGNFTNAPTASKGFELQFVGNLTPNWSVIFGYGNFDPTTGGQITIPIVEDDGNGNPVDTGRVFVVQEGGDPLIGVAEQNISLATRYKFTDGPLNGFTVGGNVVGSQGIRAGFDSNGNLIEFEDFLRLSLMVRYEKEFGDDYSWQSTLNLNNVLDETYRLGTIGGARWGNPVTLRWTNSIRF